MNFKQSLHFLDSLINYEQTPRPYNNIKLDRFKNLLKDLGNPEKRLKNVILVAGTKGKGSVCHFLESCLHHCGLRTGHFTKPHLISVRERIKVLKKPISETNFARLVTKVRPFVIKHQCTYFEAITVMAFLYFLEKNLEYTILEVGLGGRLDSTNVTNPIVSVITRIGYDHTEVLGKTITKIALEKAAIIHTQTYVVSSNQRPAARKLIKKRVKDTRSELYLIGKDLKIIDEKIMMSGSRFIIKMDNSEREFFIPVLGRHQIENGATAIGVLQRLIAIDNRISWQGIRKGFKEVNIPARCQIVQKNPLVMVDVAHNPDSVISLRNTIQNIFHNKVILIFGASKEKMVKEMFKIIMPITKKIILTKAKSPRAYDPKDLAELIKPYSVHCQITKTAKEAIGEGMKKASKNEMIVITGSFYVAGEALKILRPTF